MTRDDLLARYAAGERDFSRAHLPCADLRDADLAGASFRGAYLPCADLRGAGLKGTDLGGACLVGAYLPHASLGDANLTGADLTGARLRGGPIEEELPKIRLLGRAVNLGADGRGRTLWAFRTAGGAGGRSRWALSAGRELFESVAEAQSGLRRMEG